MLSSSIAVFIRSLNQLFQEFENKEVSCTHLDTFLVIVRYSTVCFDNTNFTKYLSRTINMVSTYSEYVKMLVKNNNNNEVMVSNDALQLILHRFPSSMSGNSTIQNAKSDFSSEIGMLIILDTIKKNQLEYITNSHKMNELAEEIYKRLSK